MMGLVIAGGQSSRMGRDKAALIFRGSPLYARAIEALRPFCEKVYVSLRSDSSLIDAIAEPKLFDRTPGRGPGEALITAHLQEPTQDFLVMACDFPYVDSSSIKHLVSAHLAKSDQTIRVAITCFEHAAGSSANALANPASDSIADTTADKDAVLDTIPEPLFGIWTTEALAQLKVNFENGRTGPMATLKELEARATVRRVSPPTRFLLFNTNTPLDWDQLES